MDEWKPADWALLLTALTGVIAALATAVAKVIGALRGVEEKVEIATSKVEALEVKVDGRLTQLLERTTAASRAEGVVAGRGEMVAATVYTPIPALALAPVVPEPALPVVPEPPEAEPLEVTAQDDGSLVLGIPTPMPPVLLIPVEAPNHDKEKPEDP